MEFPPPRWDAFPMDDFETALPRATGDLGMELMMMTRPNGRMLDHYRVSLGGSKILDITFPMSTLLNLPAAAKWRFRHQIWPKDVELRRNMTTSLWTDLSTLLTSNDAFIMDESDEPIPTEQVLDEMKKEGASASFRFAVVVGEDHSMRLQLQGLPAAATVLMAKPALRG
jgi:hypothetical protein